MIKARMLPILAQLGHKESIKDTARVLGRMYDAIEYRGYEQGAIEELAQYAGVPVYNGLTDTFHPTQILADVLTMLEFSTKLLHQISYCYVGDAHYNMGNSLLLIGAKLGMDVRLCALRSLWPQAALVEQCQAIAANTGARLMLSDIPQEAVKDVDFIYTDVWVSMGEPAEKWGERIKLLLPYQINAALMAATGNAEAKLLHCLPAFHDTQTEIGKEVAQRYGLHNGIEVTNEVFEANAFVIFEQAENRLHTIKAILVATLAQESR
jgi:ornithine carbamoyltransferase